MALSRAALMSCLLFHCVLSESEIYATVFHCLIATVRKFVLSYGAFQFIQAFCFTKLYEISSETMKTLWTFVAFFTILIFYKLLTIETNTIFVNKAYLYLLRAEVVILHGLNRQCNICNNYKIWLKSMKSNMKLDFQLKWHLAINLPGILKTFVTTCFLVFSPL